MKSAADRYASVGRRDFRAALEHLLETEFKLIGSHRVIRLIVDAVVELQREFYPEYQQLEPGTILWATTKVGEQAKVSYGKRTEAYGIQLVRLPLVTKVEIAARMRPGPGRDPRDNRRKEFARDTGTLVRLVKSAAAQGGLLSGAELSLLMNRTVGKIHDYIRTHESTTGEALPLKGYLLDMGSSPTHKGIICRKAEEGMSPPDIARATGHGLPAVDNYLGTYERIKLLLRKGFDVPTLCQVSGKAPKTVAQYLVIVEAFHPELLTADHREWLHARRRYATAWGPVPRDELTKIAAQLEKGTTRKSDAKAIVDPAGPGEAGSDQHRPQSRRKPRNGTAARGQKSLIGQMS